MSILGLRSCNRLSLRLGHFKLLELGYAAIRHTLLLKAAVRKLWYLLDITTLGMDASSRGATIHEKYIVRGEGKSYNQRPGVIGSQGSQCDFAKTRFVVRISGFGDI